MRSEASRASNLPSRRRSAFSIAPPTAVAMARRSRPLRRRSGSAPNRSRRRSRSRARVHRRLVPLGLEAIRLEGRGGRAVPDCAQSIRSSPRAGFPTRQCTSLNAPLDGPFRTATNASCCDSQENPATSDRALRRSSNRRLPLPIGPVMTQRSGPPSSRPRSQAASAASTEERQVEGMGQSPALGVPIAVGRHRVKGRPDISGRSGPAIRVGIEQRLDDSIEPLRNIGHPLTQAQAGSASLPAELLGEFTLTESVLPRPDLHEHAAERVEIGSPVPAAPRRTSGAMKPHVPLAGSTDPSTAARPGSISFTPPGLCRSRTA